MDGIHEIPSDLFVYRNILTANRRVGIVFALFGKGISGSWAFPSGIVAKDAGGYKLLGYQLSSALVSQVSEIFSRIGKVKSSF